MRSLFSRMNPTVRGLLVIAAIAGVVVLLQLEQSVVAIATLARIAFFLAIAFFLFLVWRERRADIGSWPPRATIAFYAAAIVLVADIGAYVYGGARGLELLAFLAVIVLCAVAMFRIWRDQHHYV